MNVGAFAEAAFAFLPVSRRRDFVRRRHARTSSAAGASSRHGFRFHVISDRINTDIIQYHETGQFLHTILTWLLLRYHFHDGLPLQNRYGGQ